MKYKILLLAIIIATISFNGCGTTDSSSSASSSSEAVSSGSSSSEFTSNLSQPLNSAGYYGDDVYFGGMKIVGNWNYQYTFNSDGSIGLGTSIYGVSEDGNRLYLDFTNYGESFEYISNDENNTDCINTFYTYAGDIGYSTTQKLCKLSD